MTGTQVGPVPLDEISVWHQVSVLGPDPFRSLSTPSVCSYHFCVFPAIPLPTARAWNDFLRMPLGCWSPPCALGGKAGSPRELISPSWPTANDKWVWEDSSPFPIWRCNLYPRAKLVLQSSPGVRLKVPLGGPCLKSSSACLPALLDLAPPNSLIRFSSQHLLLGNPTKQVCLPCAALAISTT